MTKIWKIIKYEYTRHVFQKRFLFSLLSLPVFVLVMVGVAFIAAFFSIDTSPVGYMDPAGMLENAVREEMDDSIFDPQIEFLPYQDLAQAEADLQAGDIQAYYILPESYEQALQVELVFYDEPAGEIQSQFNDFLTDNLTLHDNLDPQIEARLEDGSLITMKAVDGSREMRQDQWFVVLIPIIAGIMFFVVIMTSGGYLLQAVVEEKENRTMEIVITSVSPNQLMTGKIIGNIAVGLTQLVAWLIFAWIGLKVGGQFWPVLQDFSLPANYVAVLLLVLLPSFVMIAALMAAIGATMTELREAQQVQGLFSLTIMVPYYLSSSLMMNPNSPLAIGLSYFPLTAPVTILMRFSSTVIPAWQIAIHILLLIAFAAAAIWFSGRAFRMGMLRYGKKLSLKEIFGKGVEK